MQTHKGMIKFLMSCSKKMGGAMISLFKMAVTLPRGISY